MTRLEFMNELESLLLDIPLEEREEALQYYNGYFEDAGEDHADEIMTELGSPSRVASTIKADLNSNITDRENRGYFTEKGYQDTIIKDDKFELVKAPKAEENSNSQGDAQQTGNNGNNQAGYANNQTGSNTYNQSGSYSSNQNGTYNSNQQGGNGYYQQGQSYSQQQKKNSPNVALIIILCIFAVPILLPLAISILSVAFGLIMAVIGVFIAFGVAGISMIGAGVALFIAGLVKMGIPLIGLALCGSGLIVFGLGMLFTILCIFLAKTVLPAMVKGIVNLCRIPFRNRSVAA